MIKRADRICCPKFNSKKWDKKTFLWKNKPFLKETIPTFFHIPFPPMIGRKITKMMNLAEKVNKISRDKLNVLILFTDPTPFRSEIYFSVTGNVPTANNAKLSGKFMSKVFTGNYNAIPKFIKEMNVYLKSKNKKPKNYYVHYAYCPKCAKKYGGNKMILFARV